VEYFSNANKNFFSRKVVQTALGEAHTLVLDNFGQVYSFGWGQLGQLGVPSGNGKF
jgi:alpha-tubulin suppressor-like RCC1 family protein